MMRDPRHKELTYGTCVALGPHAALLRGASGSGKSDLALRFLALSGEDTKKARLVADDQVILQATDRGVMASSPEALAGLIEVRGLGIQPAPSIPSARLVLVCDLVEAADVPRMPPEPFDPTALVGADIPSLRLAPFEASTPLKLRMAILNATALLRAVEQ